MRNPKVSPVLSGLITIIQSLLFSIGCTSLHPVRSANPSMEALSHCPSSREYAATFHFLDANRETYGLSGQEIHQTSFEVAKGCKGAAARFIGAYNILIKVGLGGKNSIKTSVALSKLSDNHSKAFTDIFLQSYLEDKLNLDIQSSFKMAMSLSIEFAGKPQQAVEDFSKFTHFCMNDPAVNADVATCAKLASTIIKKTEHYSQSAFKEFTEIFFYIKQKSTLNLNTSDALTLSQEVITSGPGASENFRLAYEFGIADKGLNHDARKALIFARQMIKVSRDHQKVDRLPASKSHSQP